MPDSFSPAARYIRDTHSMETEMPFRVVGTIMMLGVLAATACGREGSGGGGGSDQPPFERPERQGGGEAVEGNVVEVRMTGNGSTVAAFEPAQLSITPGTTVRFINVSGGPHNVAFWADSIPAGAAPVLNEAMPDRVGSLTSKFATAPSETIELSFPSNVPTGTYKGYCVPHLAMGMKIDITVR